MKRLFSMVTALAVSGMTMSLYAQMPMRGPVPFAEYDTNKDGSISKSEFEATRQERMKARAEEGRMMRNAGNAPDFAYFDTDKDGKITPAELQEGQAKRMQERPGGMGPR